MTKIKKLDWDFNSDILDDEYLNNSLDEENTVRIIGAFAYDLGIYQISYYDVGYGGRYNVTETPLIREHYTDVWEESSESVTKLMEMCQKDFESIILYCIED